MKAYKRYSSAIKAADGNIILQVGDLYIVGADQHTPIDLIAGDNAATANKRTITGTIILKHLDRLGNANWATARKAGHPSKVFCFYSNIPESIDPCAPHGSI